MGNRSSGWRADTVKSEKHRVVLQSGSSITTVKAYDGTVYLVTKKEMEKRGTEEIKELIKRKEGVGGKGKEQTWRGRNI